MGLLDGGIQSLFGVAFASLYLPAALVRVTVDGDSEALGAPQAVKVQKDDCSELMRGESGYTATDVRFLVLQSGVTGGDIDTDCRIIFDGVTYDVASVRQDPAKSYWECRAQVLF